MVAERQGALRVALLSYRGNPTCGGQGVYTRHLARALLELGHEVTVLSGQPYPELDAGVGFVPVPSLDLYREPDPFRIPRWAEYRDRIDLVEVATMLTGGFPEPRTFSQRARRLLATRLGEFDIVHDNQSLGPGILGMLADGWPVLGTIHHPITVDRSLELAGASTWTTRLSLRRWYGFVAMQARVARRLARIVTVSHSSKADIVTSMGVQPDRIAVVAVGVDAAVFAPRRAVMRIRGRIMTTASADVALKGLVPLLRGLKELRERRPEAHLVILGRLREESAASRLIAELDLRDAVRVLGGVPESRVAELYAEAEVAVVPSLYEGFSLPAIEAMACGVPLVATTGGALPEVTGIDNETVLAVPPGDPPALAHALGRLLDSPELCERIGRAGRERVLRLFTWQATARATVDQYRAVLGGESLDQSDPGHGVPEPATAVVLDAPDRPTRSSPC